MILKEINISGDLEHQAHGILRQWEKMKYSVNEVGITGQPSGEKISSITIYQEKFQMDQQLKYQK